MTLSLKEYAEKINRYLANDTINGKAPEGLYAPISYTMESGGKRLRPVLLLLCCDALGGDSSKAINQAAGLEYFHNFTLLHDDVMDCADIRRGRPTVHVKWTDNHAILSGDAMLTIATMKISEGLTGGSLKKTLEVFNTTAMEIYEGQQYDMDFETSENVTTSDYLNMIRLKTSVLFGAAAKIGGIMANADTDTLEKLYRFSVDMGLAFQLQDDYLDVFGNKESFGKAIGGDIINGKRTFLLISAFNEADNATKEELNSLLSLSDPKDYIRKINGVTTIYRNLGIDKMTQDEIKKYFDRSMATIKEIPFTEEGETAVMGYVGALFNRKL